jgi:hypothetical protein
MPYNIGAIGMSIGNATSFAGAISIEGHECVVVQNGLQNLFTTTNGQFVNTCLVNLPNSSELQFATFPNPATNYFVIKGINLNQNLTATNFVIDIKNMLGQSQVKLNTNSIALSAGVKINTAMLVAGEYYVQIQSNNIQTTFLKMLKVN